MKITKLQRDNQRILKYLVSKKFCKSANKINKMPSSRISSRIANELEISSAKADAPWFQIQSWPKVPRLSI